MTAEGLFFNHPIAANTTVGDVSWPSSNSNNIQAPTIAGHAALNRRAKHRRAVSSETRHPSLHRQVAVTRTSGRSRPVALRPAARPSLAHRSHHRRQHVRALALGLWAEFLLRHLFRRCRLPRHTSGPHVFTHPFRMVLVAVAVVIGSFILPSLAGDAWTAFRRGDTITALVLVGVVVLFWLLKRYLETGQIKGRKVPHKRKRRKPRKR